MIQISILYAITFLKNFFKQNWKILDYILLIVSVLLYSFRNVHEADTEVYYAVYEALNSVSGISLSNTYEIDVGFLWLMKFFTIFHIPFAYFRMAIFSICCFLISKTIKKITPNISLVFCLYLYFPFSYDSDQIRQFLAYSIIIFGMGFLLDEDKKIIKYCLCIVGACLVHFDSFIFLIYLLVYVSNDKFLSNLIKVVSAISVIFVLAGGNLIGLLGRFISSDKLLRYSFDNSDYRMNIFLSIFEIFMVFAFVYIDNIALKEEDEITTNKKHTILNLSVIFLPLILFSLTFERLIRPFLLLSYAEISSISDYKKRNLLTFISLSIIVIRMSVSFGYIRDIFTDCVLL